MKLSDKLRDLEREWIDGGQANELADEAAELESELEQHKTILQALVRLYDGQRDTSPGGHK